MFRYRERSETVGSEIPEDDDNEHLGRRLSTPDLFVKDAFLVFRALSKLTMKPLNTERYLGYFSYDSYSY